MMEGQDINRIRNVWYGMKDRCYNPDDKEYHRYGGRGIKICDEWLNDPKRFYAWAFLHGYDNKAPKWSQSIDRIDNDGNYCPENCQFLSSSESSRKDGGRQKRIIDWDGRKMTIAEIAPILGLTEVAFRQRLSRRLPPEKLFAEYCPADRKIDGALRARNIRRECFD